MNEHPYILSADIGGSHIACAMVSMDTNSLVEKTYHKAHIDGNNDAEHIVGAWCKVLRQSMRYGMTGRAIGIAMPGPFNYEKGISYMKGQGKFEALYKKNVRQLLQAGLQADIPIIFENDAACFGIGQTADPDLRPVERLLVITLGTGIGSAFIENQALRTTGDDIPPNGYLYNMPYLDGIAEDYISGRWMARDYEEKTGIPAKEVKEIARLAESGDRHAQAVFSSFGGHIGHFLGNWIKRFRPACLVLGGSITLSGDLFLPATQSALADNGISIKIKTTTDTEHSAIIGAAIAAGRLAGK